MGVNHQAKMGIHWIIVGNAPDPESENHPPAALQNEATFPKHQHQLQ